MIDQEHQSPEAASQGCCHTKEECGQMFVDLTPELKAPALKMLAEELDIAKTEIKMAYNASPVDWAVPCHFHWGMAIRNLLRTKGFGEDYFGVHNLDDIYIPLVEEALELK